jgi:hypothetical protein
LQLDWKLLIRVRLEILTWHVTNAFDLTPNEEDDEDDDQKTVPLPS